MSLCPQLIAPQGCAVTEDYCCVASIVIIEIIRIQADKKTEPDRTYYLIIQSHRGNDLWKCSTEAD